MRTHRVALDVVQIPTPCTAPWDEMSRRDAGEGSERFCPHCDRHVHDLSAMTSAEADNLICRNAGNLCVRFERAKDGRVRTLDYAPRAAGWRKGRWLAAGTILALAAGVGNLVMHRRHAPNVVMGMMPAPVVSPPSGAGANAMPCDSE